MNNSIDTPDKFENEAHFLDYLIVLAKYSRMIIYTSAMVTILSYLVFFIKPNKYTATARIMPPQQSMALTSQLLDFFSIGVDPGKSSLSMGVASALGLKSPSDMYVGILEGNTIQDRIIARFDLRDHYNAASIEDARRSLKSNASIKAGKKDYLIYIEVTDEDRTRAQAMANALGEELDIILQEVSKHDAENQLDFLEKERAKVIVNLSRAEEALRDFSEKSSVIQIDAQAKGMIEYIANLRATIDAKEVYLGVLRSQATSSNYDVIRQETELKGLKEKLAASEAQAEQQKCVGDVCIATGKMPKLGLEYFRLLREVKYQETLSQLFFKLCQLGHLDVAKNVEVVQFIDKAKPPEKRSNKRMFPAVLVGFLTFWVMVFVAFGKEALGTYKDPAQERRYELLMSQLKPWREIWEKIKGIRLRKYS